MTEQQVHASQPQGITDSALAAPRLGVVGLPQLAALLSDTGFAEVVTGETFNGAAAAVKTAMRATGPFPVIVADHQVPGFRAWVEHAQQQAGVVIVHLDHGCGVDVDGVTSVRFPGTVDSVLTACQLPMPAHLTRTEIAAVLGTRISGTGNLLTGPQPVPAPAKEQWPDLPEQPDHSPPPWLSDTTRAAIAKLIERAQTEPPAGMLHNEPARLDMPESSVDVADLFDEVNPGSTNRTSRVLRGRGELIVVTSAKGGVGKSTTSQAIAAAAAASGQNTILIDGAIGQGDLRTYLRLGSADLPSIYDAAATGNPRSAVIPPDSLNAARPLGIGKVGFALVLTPTSGLARTGFVTTATYRAVIDYALSVADVVVLDTQIVTDDPRTREMADHLIVPLLRKHAWVVGVTDASAAGISNLVGAMRGWVAEGVSCGRIMSLLNRVTSVHDVDVDRLSALLSTTSHFVGTIYHDPDVLHRSNAGQALTNVPALAHVCELVLERVCDIPVVSAPATVPGHKPKSFGLRPWFGRK